MHGQIYIAIAMQVMQHSYYHAHLFDSYKLELVIIYNHLFLCDTQMQ